MCGTDFPGGTESTPETEIRTAGRARFNVNTELSNTTLVY